MKTSIYSYTLTKLEEKLLTFGIKKFVARQVFEWIYKKRVVNFDEMKNVSKANLEIIKENFVINNLKESVVQKSKDGTVKFLFEMEDGTKNESVLMDFDYGYSICVSTQVGCNMGCGFCASGLVKKDRNLTVDEMVLQVLCCQRELDKDGIRVSHLVLMGSGEPFDNFDNVIDFINIVNHPYGLEIGARHITVSTCGIVPKIMKFADLKLQVNLAISLHAPNDEIRDKIMPINKAYPIEKLLDAVWYYQETTRRRVTFEYILIRGLNDSPEHAEELAERIRGFMCLVNIIPCNPVFEAGFLKSNRAGEFHEILMDRGIQSTIRIEKGSDIDAACGQLRAKVEKKIGIKENK